jgi:hypothetical protein
MINQVSIGNLQNMVTKIYLLTLSTSFHHKIRIKSKSLSYLQVHQISPSHADDVTNSPCITHCASRKKKQYKLKNGKIVQIL